MTASFKWDPSRLNGAISRAARTSFVAAQVDAKARLHEKKKSGVKLESVTATSATLRATGLGPVFEEGRKGGYPINPTGVAGLRRSFSRTKGSTYKVRSSSGGTQAQFLGGPFLGHPLAFTLGGPMQPYPALAPAARDWCNGGFQKVASASLGSAGF